MKMYDLEMEKCLLGCMVLDKSIIPNVMSEVKETDFFNEQNRIILRAILKLDRDGKGIDIKVLNAETGYKLTEQVVTVTDSVPTSANWFYYASKIKNLTMVRDAQRIKEIAGEITPENVDEKIQEIISISNTVSDNKGGIDIRSAYEMMNPVIDNIEFAYKNRGNFSGIDTGFETLNKILDGLQDELYIIGARPSIGKSALAVNMAKSMAMKGTRIGYFSLEMSGTALMMRMLADTASVQAQHLRNGRLDMAAFQRITEMTMTLGKMPFYISDSSDGNINKVCAKARYMVRCLGVQVIFIDYISLLSHTNQRIPRHEQFAEIAVIIQKLKKELDIPIVEIVQLTRDTEGKKPCMADVRESGAFEQTADCIILLDRKRAEDKDETKIPTDAIVVKNRNGACGTAFLSFIPQVIRFTDDTGRSMSIEEMNREEKREWKTGGKR